MSSKHEEWLGLVRVKPGRRAFREGYLRDMDDGIFRLYETPPARDIPAREPRDGERPEHVPSMFDKWLGDALEVVTDPYEIEAYLHSAANTDFSEQVQADDISVVMGRAGAIVHGVSQLDHSNDTHWTKDGLPDAKTVGNITGLVNVQPHEIAATVPDVRRLPESQREQRQPVRGRTAKG